MTYTEIHDALIARLKEYHPSNDFSLVEKAYDLAVDAHWDQYRKSGEPYIIHPLSVAYVLATLELDLESITAGILHDVIEDTNYTYRDIVFLFGQEVADIVDGVTKLETIEGLRKPDPSIEPKPEPVKEGGKDKKDKNYREELQAENYRKMFLAMAKDIRVILIKVADRLHNMRTLKYMTPEKQKIIAQETLDIYAPLAHRLGISKIRYELEDLSFRYLNPDEYFDLADKVRLKQAERLAYIDIVVKALSQKLEGIKVKASVEGRPKHFFSIYKKMKSKEKSFDQIYDLFAVRVMVDGVKECYEVLGVVHEMYSPIPGTFKDYIGMPKPNMYQSLHTVVIGPEGEPVEVQIRTWEMHRTAEFGIAAHWKYKEGRDDGSIDKGEEKLAWLRQILDWQRSFTDNKEFMNALKTDLDIFNDHVYCFSPRGEIIRMVSGANCVDFAYAIHSAVGNKMVGARVNGSIVPIDYVLSSGDRVEIITSNNSKGPSRDWLKAIKTNQARLKIQQWFKKENKEENAARGREMLEKEAKEKGYTMAELLSPERRATVLEKFSFQDWDSLCSAIGHGGIKEGQVVNRLKEDFIKEREKNITPEMRAKELLQSSEEKAPKKRRSMKKSGIVVKGIGDIDVRFSKCCSPVPGDEIVGFVTRGRGVSVHRTDCVNVINLEELERNRLMEAEWQQPDKAVDHARYFVEIRIIADDKMGLLVDISRIFAEEKIPVKSMNARTGENGAVFNVGLEITGKDQLDGSKRKLLSVPGIHDIERVTT